MLFEGRKKLFQSLQKQEQTKTKLHKRSSCYLCLGWCWERYSMWPSSFTCRISRWWTMCSTADCNWSVVMLCTWSTIEFRKSLNVTTPPQYTRLFKWLHNQKLYRFRSGEHANRGWGKKWLTHSSVKCWSNSALDSLICGEDHPGWKRLM